MGGKAPQVIGMLQALGLSADDARRYATDTTKALPELADKIAALRDPTLQAQAATALFGASGEAMLPFLRRGAAGIAEYSAEAAKYGTVNAAGVAAADRLRESQTRLQLAVEGLGNSVAEKLAPVIGPLLAQMADWIARNRDWIATGIGDKVGEFARWLQSVDWGKIGSDIGGIFNATVRVVTALSDWMPAGTRVMEFFGLAWLTSMLAPMLAISAKLLRLPFEAAIAAGKATGELAKIGKGGALATVAKLAGTAFIADQALTAVDPNDRMGAWMDRNVPGASWLDNAASHIGLGRSYGEQARVEGLLNPGAAAGGAGGRPAQGPGQQPALPRNAAATQDQWNKDLSQLMGKGWTKDQAAGILGNLDQESGGNHQIVGDEGKAYGLAQWHPDRQANFAKKFGHDIRQSTHEEQVDFVDHELRTTESGAGMRLAQAQNVGDASATIRRYYERPANKTGQEDVWRTARAQRILSGADAPASPPPAGDKRLAAGAYPVRPRAQPASQCRHRRQSRRTLDRGRARANRHHHPLSECTARHDHELDTDRPLTRAAKGRPCTGWRPDADARHRHVTRRP